MRKIIPINSGVAERLKEVEEAARDCTAFVQEYCGYLDTYIDTFPSDVEPTVVEFPRDKVDRALAKINETPNVVYLETPKMEKR